MNFIKGLARQTGTPPTPLAVSPRSPDVGEVIKGFDIADIATMVVVGGLSFPVGYAIGKPIRTPSMWVMGGLGTVAGFLLGFQNSSGKLQLPPSPPPLSLHLNKGSPPWTLTMRWKRWCNRMAYIFAVSMMYLTPVLSFTARLINSATSE